MATLLGQLMGGRSLARSATDVQNIDDYIEAVTQYAGGMGWLNPSPQVSETLPGEQGSERPVTDFGSAATQLFGGSSVVFACMLARLAVFSEARLQYQRMRGGRPGDLFGDPSLSIFEVPWIGGITADLLVRMITDADLAGNSYIVEDQGELVRLRPDWVDIVMVPRYTDRGRLNPREPLTTMGWRKIGYLYYEDGIRDDRGTPFLVDEVAHFAPIPDPLAAWRGMSWVTRLAREVEADRAMTTYKARFLRNNATPNMVVKHQPQVTPDQVRKFAGVLEDRYAGATNAGKTMHLGGGADLTIVGQNFAQLDFKAVQGAGETRIAAAAGTPPIIVGLSEGLSSATYSNYAQARRRFADGTMRPLWRNAAGSLATLRPAPAGARLFYDVRDVAFLREDAADQAKITATNAQTIRNLVDAGFEPESVTKFVASGDPADLVHTGRLSVQLQQPGKAPDGTDLDGGPSTDDLGDSDSGDDTDPAARAATNGRAIVPIPRELLTHG
jgi:Phage portal protein